jgi:outer membrane protein TolC
MRVLQPLLDPARRAGVSLAIVLAAGCAAYDPGLARRAHTTAFTNALAQRAAAALAQPLSLDACVRLAMTNNYAVRRADLDRELSRIGKNVAFTVFLPTVAASAGYTSHAKDPGMSELRSSRASLDLGMPIFLPSSWFLYAATRHGYAATGIAAAYVRQGIVLQTTTAYFDVLVAQDTVAALESQSAAARETAARVQAFAKEGFVKEWERAQAIQLAEAREAELNQARRALTRARGELLACLGFSPLAEIRLSGDVGEAAAPAGPVDALVLRALEIHPELALADREVVIREHQVRQAFCGFLPTLSVFSSGSWTSDDLALQAANWATGLSGVWTLFDGLANVARYKAARVERRQGELARESAFLSVMVRVIAAEAVLRDATEAARLRRRAYEIAVVKTADYEAQALEGLLPVSEALDARAAMDRAHVELVRTRYQERLAIATLELAMGLTALPN